MDWSDMFRCEAIDVSDSSLSNLLIPAIEAGASLTWWLSGAGSPLTLAGLGQRRLTTLIYQRGCSRKKKRKEKKGRRKGGRKEERLGGKKRHCGREDLRALCPPLVLSHPLHPYESRFSFRKTASSIKAASSLLGDGLWEIR